MHCRFKALIKRLSSKCGSNNISYEVTNAFYASDDTKASIFKFIAAQLYVSLRSCAA